MHFCAWGPSALAACSANWVTRRAEAHPNADSWDPWPCVRPSQRLARSSEAHRRILLNKTRFQARDLPLALALQIVNLLDLHPLDPCKQRAEAGTEATKKGREVA